MMSDAETAIDLDAFTKRVGVYSVIDQFTYRT